MSVAIPGALFKGGASLVEPGGPERNFRSQLRQVYQDRGRQAPRLRRVPFAIRASPSISLTDVPQCNANHFDLTFAAAK